MKHVEYYENYPLSTVLTASLLQLSIFSMGAYIISLTGLIWMAVYIIFILWMEIRLMTKSCVNCYYYGKTCFSGMGRLAPLFKKGDPDKFINGEISLVDVIPDFIVSFAPAVAGIILLVKDFSVPLLAVVLSLIALTTWGNGFVRSTLACKNCKQRLLGCPAERMLNKRKS